MEQKFRRTHKDFSLHKVPMKWNGNGKTMCSFSSGRWKLNFAFIFSLILALGSTAKHVTMTLKTRHWSRSASAKTVSFILLLKSLFCFHISKRQYFYENLFFFHKERSSNFWSLKRFYAFFFVLTFTWNLYSPVEWMRRIFHLSFVWLFKHSPSEKKRKKLKWKETNCFCGIL